MTYGNGLTETDTYSLDYEINRLLVANGATSLIDRTHARVDSLNLTGITDAVTPANNQTFTYSSVNRLASASGNYGLFGWTYDGVGNRTGQTLAGVTSAYAYPTTSNRLSTIGGTARVFVHDAAGNIATDTRAGVLNAYTYNNANRLKTVTVAANLKATYTYDAARHTAIRILINMTPSGAIHTVYDREGNPLMESNGVATGITREYVWLPETQIAATMGTRADVPRPIAVIDAVNTATPATWWVSTDHLNRPVRMTDAAKATVWQATWKPFGEPQAITGSATLDARFPGQWFQLESGLHQNWWRHYDPTTGRYTQTDPMGFVDGPSLFGYALANPGRYVDKQGLDIWIEGPSYGEPDWHQSVNVGDPMGTYHSYSYGSYQYIVEGIVYPDQSHGGEIDRNLYKNTTPQQDDQFDQFMQSKLGMTGYYGPGQVCRNWSQNQFNGAPGTLSEPPTRPVVPQSGTVPWLTNTSTGATNGSTASTSKW